MEENKTIEENIIGNIEGDNIKYEFSELSSIGIQFKSFYYKQAHCIYIYDQSDIDTIILDQFVNASKGTADGRKLLNSLNQNSKFLCAFSLVIGFPKKPSNIVKNSCTSGSSSPVSVKKYSISSSG